MKIALKCLSHTPQYTPLFPFFTFRATLIRIQYRVNNQITARELRVIGEDGTNFGVLSLTEALALAKQKGSDLIEISANANPPVARVMDFDKFRYQKEKEARKQRMAEKAKEMKEIRITPRAAKNDLEVKARKASGFPNEGHKVQINVFLRGREKGNKEWAFQKLNEFLPLITVPFTKSVEPKVAGRGLVMQISKK